MFYWLLKIIFVGPVLKVLFRPFVEGAEHVPEQGAAILASNHLSFSDSIFLPIMLKRRITFPAKMEYFTGRGVKGRLTAAFFKGVGQIPIDRSGGRASEAAISSAMRVLRRGELFGIYPEGTRSPDGRLYKGKTGIARMALEAGCPVIPVAMINTDKAQPTGKKIPNIIRIGIKIGAPLDFSRYEGMENDRFVLRSITDEIMYELMLLSGQEYVDVYATSLKKNVLKDTVAKASESVQKAGETISGSVQKAGETISESVQKAGESISESVQTAVARAREIQETAAAAAAAAAAVAKNTPRSGASAGPTSASSPASTATSTPADVTEQLPAGQTQSASATEALEALEAPAVPPVGGGDVRRAS